MDRPTHKTMELRVSQNQAELQQAISARQSNRSMSTVQRDELERRVQELLREKADLEQELARCKITIQNQSQIIQKPQSGHKSHAPQYLEHRNAHHVPSPYPRSDPPPQFDPSGAAADATLINRSSQHGHNHGSYQQPSNLPQPVHQHVSRPDTNPHPTALPGTLGYGLTVEQRAQQPSKPPPAINQTPRVYRPYDRLSPSSLRMDPTQPFANQLPTPFAKNSHPVVPSPAQAQKQALTTPKQPFANQLPESTNSYSVVPQRQVSNPIPPTSMALVKHTNTPEDLGFPEKFKTLFTMSEQFAFSHVNFPSTARDGMLPSYIKAKLESIAGQSAGNLMSNGVTRYHLVARVMSQWLIKHVLKRSCFVGLDKVVDANIERLAGSIYQTTPTSVRNQILNNIGQEIKRLTARPDFKDFFNQRCKHRGNDLWAIVFPMMNRKTSKDWEDMMSLMVEAHNLAGMMLGGPYEWSFTFHDIGAPFQSSTMVNKDPFMPNHVPAELAKQGAVVRLGVSPLVVARTYSSNGTMDVSTVASAFVLTKWPQF